MLKILPHSLTSTPAQSSSMIEMHSRPNLHLSSISSPDCMAINDLLHGFITLSLCCQIYNSSKDVEIKKYVRIENVIFMDTADLQDLQKMLLGLQGPLVLPLVDPRTCPQVKA